ncbi:hypothetical protein [Embleya sp. NPDC059237]|uniref:hypothetical protein n=1 Tax=Embleya sp. NPDC059237 TaxID=3346784 RepID=UPI0036A2C6D3
MVTVPWRALSDNEKKYRALVSMLVLRLRPRARSIEGSGGDRGKDLVEYDEDNRLIIYELKSFTGRLDKDRRRQVKDSLITAAQHQPDAWDLLVPVLPTNGEWEWFDGLRKDFPFVRKMWHRDRLDEKLSKHTDLVRSVQEPDGYLAERLAELNAEHAVMHRGIPDLVERYEALERRAREISVHYDVSVSRTGSATVTTVSAKRDGGAVEVPPIVLSGEVVFERGAVGDAARRDLEEALTYGGDVRLGGEHLRRWRVRAPAELGLSQTMDRPDRLTLSAHRVPLRPALCATLSLLGGSGIPVRSVPVRFDERAQGRLGATYHGEDLTGLWSTRLRVDERGWTLDVTQREAAMLPGAALPMLRLLAAARAGDTLRLGMPVDGRTRFLDVVLAEDLQDDDYRVWASAVETLHAVQERTAASFPVPARMTGLDVRNVRDALRLLDGEAVTVGNGDVLTIKGLHPGAGALERLTAPGRFQVAVVRQAFAYDFEGWQLPLGPCAETCVVEGLMNPDEVREAIASGGPARLCLRLAPGQELQRRLLAHLPPGADLPTTSGVLYVRPWPAEAEDAVPERD